MRIFHLALLASASVLPAQNVFTSPAGMENVDGSSNHNYILFARPGMRWQQVDSTHRGQAYPNIASIAWRRDAAVASAATSTARTLTGMQVFLADSTVGGLSTDFDGNYANPATEVFTPKPVNLPDWTVATGASPEPFDIVLPLDVPWSYAGTHDLLWEVRYTGNSAVPAGTASTNYQNDFQATSGVFSTSTSGTSLGNSGCTATGRTSAFSLTGTFYNHGSKFRYTQGVTNAPSNTPVVVNLGFVDPMLTIPGLCHTVHSDGVVNYTLGVSSTTGSVSTTTFDNLPYSASAVGTALFFQALAIDPGQSGIPAVLSNGRSYTIPVDPALPAVGRVYEYPLSSGSLTQSGPWTGGIVARFVY